MSDSESAEERFSALFRRHYDAVLRYALRRTEPAGAADVAAEVFLVAWRRLDDVPAEPLPWLVGTARYVLANQRRSHQRSERLRLRLRRERDPSPGEHAELDPRWAAALRGLSAADQEVLALVAWDGLTAREAAASLGCSTPAFTTRLHRARRRLAAGLGRTTDTHAAQPRPGADLDPTTEVTP